MSEIVDWLKALGLAEYVQAFVENRIELDVVGDLTDQDLKDLGVGTIGDRRRLLRAIAERAKAPVAAEVTAQPPALPQPSFAVPPTHAAERRHLTVMFCDLVGSTALAARLDPEDMRELVRAYQAACSQVIAKYQGFVAQYLGDGIMAYFGYPQAHEDDAERAVRAGLDLIAAVAKLDAKKVEVRIGIATGLVVVGDLIGEQGAKERAVTGETPNLAARLQGLAAPGTIVVSDATRRLLGGMFDLRNLGAQQVKGLIAPVEAFAVEGARSFESRFEARAGGLTGFVGRDEEVDHLLRRKRLAWQGRGQVVLVSGEAGIGKSRLTAWLADKISAEPHVRLRYQCTRHHTDSPLYPFITQLERGAGFAAGDTDARKLDKLEALLALAGMDTTAVAPLFAALLSVPFDGRYPSLTMTPAQQRQRTMAAMLDQSAALAQHKPVLIVFEDAHWADATSLDLIDMLVDRNGRWRSLVIVTARPEFAPVWAGRHNVSTLSLEKLAGRHARRMVETVTGGTTMPEEVMEHILQKTDGVPLFVEELTKAVLESGVLVEDGTRLATAAPISALAIPATLHDSLMARLDRSNPVKEIAQIGAAIGREFTYKLLHAAAGMDEATLRVGLANLETMELASRRGVLPDATWTFKHALVQDAAYESLLKSRRQVIHRRIAKCLRNHFPDVAETEPEIVAHHFTQAGRAEQAIDWWTRAGHLAQRRSAHKEASGHFARAIAIADSSPDDAIDRLSRVRLQTAYGYALLAGYGFSASAAAPVFARASELATELQDPAERFSIYYGLWAGTFIRAEPEPMRRVTDDFLAAVDGREGSTEASVAYRMSGVTRWLRGDFVGAREHLESAVAFYDPDRDRGSAARFSQNIGVSALHFLAVVAWALGDTANARALAQRSLAVGAESGHAPTLIYAHGLQCIFELVRFDPVALLPHARTCAELSAEHDLPFWLGVGTMAYGWARWHAGERDEGIADLRQSAKMFDEQRNGWSAPLQALAMADVEARSGRLDEALRVLDEFDVRNQREKQVNFDVQLLQLRGTILRRASADPSAAEAAYLQALAVARAQQARTFELRASLDLARLFCDTGRGREAVSLLQGALVGFEPTPELPEIAETQRLLALIGRPA